MLSSGADRYCKNPYFLHSLATHNPPSRATLQDFNSRHYGTISEARGTSAYKSNKNLNADEKSYRPRRKMRPFSAPKDQLKSLGLKDKIKHSQALNAG